jgi:hypothetical protein
MELEKSSSKIKKENMLGHLPMINTKVRENLLMRNMLMKVSLGLVCLMGKD